MLFRIGYSEVRVMRTKIKDKKTLSGSMVIIEEPEKPQDLCKIPIRKQMLELGGSL